MNEKDYQCGCFGLRAGWYEVMGISIKEKLLKCLKDGNSQCEIMLNNLTLAVLSGKEAV